MAEHNVSERTQILDEIQQCQCPRRIVSLKRQLNSLLPVSSIPVELLCEIFLCHTCGNRQGDLVDDEPVTRRTLLQVRRQVVHLSHVCHHWRNVALSTPRLWVHMMWSHNDEWTKELLVRAGRAPLLAYFNGKLRNQRDLACLQLILEKMDQIQILRLNIRGSESQVLQLHKLIDRNAPLLRSLSVEFRPHYRRNHLDASLDLSCHFPCLSQLSLTVYNLTTSLALLKPPLRTLKLNFLEGVSASLLFSALEETPSLRSLVLHGISVVVDGQQRCVALDHLQHITINGDIRTVAFILENIKSTEDLSLHLDGFFEDWEQTDWSLFLSNILSPKLCRHDQDRSQEPFDVLSIRFTSYYGLIETEWWRGAMKDVDLEDPHAMPLGRKANVTLILPSDRNPEILQALSQAIASAGVKALFLESQLGDFIDSRTKEFWSTVIQSALNLQGLWITDSNGGNLIDSILLGLLQPESNPKEIETDQDRRQQNPRYVPVSQLHSLHLNSVRFRGRYGPDPSQGTFATLLRVFGRRQRARVSLPYISISKSKNIGEEDIQVLDGTVENVDWDEEETFDRDSDLSDESETYSDYDYSDEDEDEG